MGEGGGLTEIEDVEIEVEGKGVWVVFREK